LHGLDRKIAHTPRSSDSPGYHSKMGSWEVLLLAGIVILAVLYSGDIISYVQTRFLGSPPPTNASENANTVNPSPHHPGRGTYRFCSWHIDNFGLAKASDDFIMAEITNKALTCDVLIIQGLSDVTLTTLPELCKRLPDYRCESSARKGAGTHKEQYAVVYKGVNLTKIHDSIQYSSWEYPPSVFEFDFGVPIFVSTLKTQPPFVESELTAFEEYHHHFGGRMIAMGNFHMDCVHYLEPTRHFLDWHSLIPDDADTTVDITNCAYDRIFVSEPLIGNVVDSGIDTDVTVSVSDRYMVWFDITF
jgi:hypothetical protein